MNVDEREVDDDRVVAGGENVRKRHFQARAAARSRLASDRLETPRARQARARMPANATDLGYQRARVVALVRGRSRLLRRAECRSMIPSLRHTEYRNGASTL